MPHASVNGTQLYYTESGRGIPFISLHGGLGFDHAYMRTPLAPLEDLARIVYFDQRGHGRSDRKAVPTITMRQLADDVDGLRQEFGWERIGIVGHSYGGFVALEYATTHPDRVSHLVLFDTSPGAFEPTPDELAERRDATWLSPEVAREVERFDAEPPSSDSEFAARLVDIAPVYARTIDPSLVVMELQRAIMSADAYRRGYELLGSWSVADRLGSITCPTLVGCGRHDLVTTPECAKRLATGIPNAELAWFEESGHFPWLEEPVAFQDRVRDFLVDHW